MSILAQAKFIREGKDTYHSVHNKCMRPVFMIDGELYNFARFVKTVWIDDGSLFGESYTIMERAVFAKLVACNPYYMDYAGEDIELTITDYSEKEWREFFSKIPEDNDMNWSHEYIFLPE